MSNIRLVEKEDVKGLKILLDTINLFPSEMLDGMISDYLNNPHSKSVWFTYIEENEHVALGFCIKEKLTNETYNLLAVGVSSNHQRKGIATKMISFIENYLKGQGGRLLIIETSSTEEFQKAIKLYKKLNYSKLSTIKDFWDDNDDKLVFGKKLYK
jgi:ribosomal protein S18 acetylase RimI-like enzyme